MSIDVTSGLLTSLDREVLEREHVRPVDADRALRESRLDRVMNRVLPSRALWIAPVLIVQGVLSFRPSSKLANSETSSINAGHLLIAHLLHGTAIPDFGRSLAGVPTLYAVPAALIGDVGGPTLVRLASTALALMATVFVYFASRRLFGQGAALIAGAVFALNACTLFVACFASADALCVALLAAGLWLAVTCAGRPGRAVALGPCLALAVASGYLALPFIPAVLALVALRPEHAIDDAPRRRGLRLALGSFAVSAGVALLAVAPGDFAGLRLNLLDRRVMTLSESAALHHQFWTDIGPLLAVGIVAVAVATKNRVVAGLLLITALLATGFETYVGTVDPPHDMFNLVVVFLAPLAGVTAMAMLRRGRLLGLRAPLAIAGMVVLLAAGIASPSQMMHDWPNSYDAAAAPVALDHPISTVFAGELHP